MIFIITVFLVTVSLYGLVKGGLFYDTTIKIREMPEGTEKTTLLCLIAPPALIMLISEIYLIFFMLEADAKIAVFFLFFYFIRWAVAIARQDKKELFPRYHFYIMSGYLANLMFYSYTLAYLFGYV